MSPDVARISLESCVLFVPAKTPYERELVFEHVALYVKRLGRVHLRLDRRDWLVTASESITVNACGACRGSIGALTYAGARDKLCGPCVRAATA